MKAKAICIQRKQTAVTKQSATATEVALQFCRLGNPRCGINTDELLLCDFQTGFNVNSLLHADRVEYTK
jgi:hypothetical protein